MFMLTEYKGRPTKEIDLLAQQISNDKEDIGKVFLNVCSIKYEDDGMVSFDESGVVTSCKV